jgi:hypothetical protein
MRRISSSDATAGGGFEEAE